ncbi:MAG: TIGR02147 family protein, partial [Chitinispirillaceae bacterium]|nr:TIGR02147 family protein [Chitinispirillaceae bacterium]
DRSREALDTVEKTERHVSGVTMGVSRETFHVLAAEIEALKDRLKIIVNQDADATRVYQMNVALFPVSEEVVRGENGPGGDK